FLPRAAPRPPRPSFPTRRASDLNRALGSFVESLLPVLDACDAALAQGADAVEPVLSALYGALSKEGLERIDPEGKPFDPNEAEAAVHEPGEGGEHVVAEVLRPGYRWRGQVLRPAMVKATDRAQGKDDSARWRPSASGSRRTTTRSSASARP